MRDKLYEHLLNLYRTVFNAIGVDFDTIDKVDGWYEQYEIDMEEEEKIVNTFLNSKRLSVFQKKIIKQNYYSGISPNFKV